MTTIRFPAIFPDVDPLAGATIGIELKNGQQGRPGHSPVGEIACVSWHPIPRDGTILAVTLTPTSTIDEGGAHYRAWIEGTDHEWRFLVPDSGTFDVGDPAILASPLAPARIVPGEKGDKGDKGDPGNDGDDGVDGLPGPPLNPLGSVANEAALPATANPGDMLITEDDLHAWVWGVDGPGWVDTGQFQASVDAGTLTQVPPGTPASVTNVGTLQAAVFDFQLPPAIDVSGVPIDAEDGLTSWESFLELRGRWIDPADYGAVNDGVADDGLALQAAINDACATDRTLVLRGAYYHNATLLWDHTKGNLVVDARGATITSDGTICSVLLEMQSQAAALPSVEVYGGTWVNLSGTEAIFRMLDCRNCSFAGVTTSGASPSKGWDVQNEGGWSERNIWVGCRSINNRHAWYGSLYSIAVTHWSATGSAATLTTSGPHRFRVGDRLSVAVGRAALDGDRTVTAVTSTTLTYASTEPTQATTTISGTVSSRGSFARTIIRDLFLQGGESGHAQVHLGDGTGPYDSLFAGIRGNVTGGAHIVRLTAGAMGGTVFSGMNVEVAAAGTVYLFHQPDGTVAARPELLDTPRLIAGSVELLTHPASNPVFAVHKQWGGIQAGGFVAADEAIVQRTIDNLDMLDSLFTSSPSNGSGLFDRTRRRVGWRSGPNTYMQAALDLYPTTSRVVSLAFDETRTTGSLSSSALVFPSFEAGTTWTIDGVLYISGPAVGLLVALDIAGANLVTWGDDRATDVTTQASNAPVSRPVPCDGTKRVLRIHGTIKATTATPITLQWAQAVTDATVATLYAGSWLRATRLV